MPPAATRVQPWLLLATASATASVTPATLTGVGRLVVVPSPSAPLKL
jgi:hypothetical protein